PALGLRGGGSSRSVPRPRVAPTPAPRRPSDKRRCPSPPPAPRPARPAHLSPGREAVRPTHPAPSPGRPRETRAATWPRSRSGDRPASARWLREPPSPRYREAASWRERGAGGPARGRVPTRAGRAPDTGRAARRYRLSDQYPEPTWTRAPAIQRTADRFVDHRGRPLRGASSAGGSPPLPPAPRPPAPTQRP